MKLVSLPAVLAACLLFGATPVLAGCGSSASSVCEAACDCEGCSDSDLDDCIDDFEDIEDDAAREGCEDQYDDYITCLDDEAECRGDDLDIDGCEDEQQDLAKCLGPGSGSGGPEAPGAEDGSSSPPGE